MNYTFKYILSSATCIALSYIPTYAQQVTNPENNIPVILTPGTPPQAPHPGLVDLTNLPEAGYNYVRTEMPHKPAASIGSNYVAKTTDFFDGLGRPLQTVGRFAHPTGYDLIQHHIYDEQGREARQYMPLALPAAQSSGDFVYNVKTKMREFYDNLGPDEPPYSETKFDNSPLNRAIKQMQPGKSWVGSLRGTEVSFRGNTTNDQVRVWTIGYALGPVPASPGVYDPNDLYVTQTVDEDGKIVLEFKDKEGKLILKKSKASDCTGTPHCGYACTYYVYDDMQRLRYVIPPKAVAGIDGTWSLSSVTDLCFSYFYDGRGRLVEKKIPGKAKEEYVYDKRDRMVFYRDGNLGPNRWAFTTYDALNRPTTTGIVDPGFVTREYLQGYIYTNATAPTNDIVYYMTHYDLMHVYPPTNTVYCKFLSYTYYDNYDQVSFNFDAAQFNGITLPPDGTVVPSLFSTATQGKVTGTALKVKDPEDANNEIWLRSANYYDHRGRLIQTQSDNMEGGTEISSNIYYFQGMQWKNILRHQYPNAQPVEGTTDPAHTEYRIVTTTNADVRWGGGSGQLLSTQQKIDNGIDYQLGNYFYDHMGRMVTKQTSAANMLQEYNVRGFLNHLQVANFNNDPGNQHIFDEKLYYDKGFGSKLYNGNIAGITWRKAGDAAPVEAYGYSYDPLNRLTHAEYRRETGPSTNLWQKDVYDYSVSNISYDINGNIEHMDQRAPVMQPNTPPIYMDQLSYTYANNSNRLIKVEDAVLPAITAAQGLPDFKNNVNLAEEYLYDDNGNLVKDENKNVTSITYSHLNKPEIITTSEGTITYFYDALGNRLRKKVHTVATNTDDIYNYIGNFVYKNDTLQYIMNTEGRARPVANSQGLTKFKYDYFVKDHLGNVRSTVTAEPVNETYLASHEIGSANVEQMVFDNIPNVRDARPGDPSHMAARLNANDPSRRVGTAIMLQVMPGDRFTISADAFYEGDYQQDTWEGSNAMIESLMSALLNGNTYAGVPTAELPDNVRTITEVFNNPALPGQLQNLIEATNDPNAPKAHLNVLFFNDKLELVEGNSSITQVPAVPMGGNMGGFVTMQPSGTASGAGTQVCCNSTGPGYVVIYIDNQSIGKDVWFDNIMIEHYTGKVQEENHYYPYGLTLQTSQEFGHKEQPYKLTTKELERSFDLNIYDFGARMQDMQLGRWWSVDPLAEKYYSVNPYAYCADNPVKLTDAYGNELWVDDDKLHLLYKDDKLYQEDGTEYKGKIKGFLKKSLTALNKINSTSTGKEMLTALSESKNIFTIKHISNNPKGEKTDFQVENTYKAHAEQIKQQPGVEEMYVKKGRDLSGGSGGVVYWDPSGVELPTTDGPGYNGDTDLAHELSHGYDADRGLLNSNKTNNVDQDEYQASYRENLIRTQLHLPLRTHYRTIIDSEGNKSYEGALLDAQGKPFLPAGYKP